MPFQELYAAAQFGYCGADWQLLFVFHGIDSDAAARHAVEEGTARHVRHLKRCFP